MPNNQKGFCLPLRRCPMLFAIATKKRLTIADRQYLRRSRCGFIGFPLVCCLTQEYIQPVERFDNSKFYIDDLPSDCGKLQLKHILDDRIVGGENAKIFDSPWQALLQYLKRMLKKRIKKNFKKELLMIDIFEFI